MKPPILLRIYLNDSLEGVRQFDVSQIVIGKNADVQLTLNHDLISPLHALIEERESGHYLSDLGSQTGTYRNGQKILDEKLESGDEVKVGPYKIQFFVGVPKPVGPPSQESAKPMGQAAIPSAPPPTPKPTIPKSAKPASTVAPVKPKQSTPAVKAKIPLGPPAAQFNKNKGRKTFAPMSAFTDARDVIRPGKGTVVEVLVTWRERVIAARHFTERGDISVGADPMSDLVVPLFPGGTKVNLVRIQSLASVYVTQDMQGELIRDQDSIPFAELFRQNRLRGSSSGYELDIQQGEMVRISFQGGNLSVFVRYVAESPKPLVAPLLDLSASEVTGVILAMVVAAIFGLYMTIYAPSDLPDEARLEEPIRKAIVTFKMPKKIMEVVEQTEKKEVVKAVAQKEKTQSQAATEKNDPGKAAEVAPKKTQDKEKKLTSARPGGATKTAPKDGANAKSQKPDPNKMGLLSVFGSKGTQSKLDKTFSGAGELQGIANQATGFAGSSESRPGDNIGTKLKDSGAGGKGTATVGISGVGTQGKGTGYGGVGTGGIGKKGSVDIDVSGQEADIPGTIDREAIRRIIQANKNAIRSCYDRALQRHPDLYGKLVLEWDIEERGRVGHTGVKSNTLGDAGVATCILQRIKSLKFPEPPPDTTARVVFPFVFSSE
jgi:hypothetical protein